MNGATIILLVVLVLGTIAIIFLRPLIDFLYKHGLEKLFDKADHFSLSETEKARGQKERRFLEASPEALQSEFEVILSTHAGRYSHKKVTLPHWWLSDTGEAEILNPAVDHFLVGFPVRRGNWIVVYTTVDTVPTAKELVCGEVISVRKLSPHWYYLHID